MNFLKFEFERPPIKNISEDLILDELEKVAKHFNYEYFSRKNFDELANIHSATVERHYGGSWSAAIKALEERLKCKNITYALNKRSPRNVSEEQILDELEKVAKHFNYECFSRKNYDELACIHSATVERHYDGSWSAAIKALEERLKHKNIILISSRRSGRNTSEKVMFDEMERIWVYLGHRPSKSEWLGADPKVSYDTIYRNFGGWTNACLKFIEYKSGGSVTIDNDIVEKTEKVIDVIKTDNPKKKEECNPKKLLKKTRTISLNIRIKVLSRDNFRCVFCGKSPATDIGTKLHVDHIIPFSKGGTNSIDNLQTLCEQCNLGKSDSVMQ